MERLCLNSTEKFNVNKQDLSLLTPEVPQLVSLPQTPIFQVLAAAIRHCVLYKNKKVN